MLRKIRNQSISSSTMNASFQGEFLSLELFKELKSKNINKQCFLFQLHFPVIFKPQCSA